MTIKTIATENMRGDEEEGANGAMMNGATINGVSHDEWHHDPEDEHQVRQSVDHVEEANDELEDANRQSEIKKAIIKKKL